MKKDPAVSGKELRGIPVYPDIVIGKAHVVGRAQIKVQHQGLVKQEDVRREIERFEESLRTVEEQFISLRNRMPEGLKDQAFILDSHLMILRDSMLRDSTIRRILDEKINAEWALKKTLEEIRGVFGQIDDPYISSRITDVENVAERIFRALSGDTANSLGDINHRVIIVAHDLSPADTTELNTAKVMGFITDVGGRTSHTAIMAQALEIPAVVGLENVTAWVEEGDLLIVDGSSGVVVINPEDSDIIAYQEKKLQLEKYKSSIARQSHLPAETPDGHRIAITANIEFLEEVAAAKDYGGEGIGLYRTEFLYLRGKGFPDEEELFEDYREVAEIMRPAPVSIRTLDLGGDKFASTIAISEENNPALGLRAIRFCLREPEIFKTQLRAILRASAYGRIQLMFPMISGLQELLDARAILDQVRKELDREYIPYDAGMEVGIMIEIPSAVAISEVLANYVDFFSIGTNDLIQYALAIDRVNEHVAFMYQPFHPAILRMILQVVNSAKKAGIHVSLCGEMAGDPLCTSILLGIGLDGLSMNARAIPLIKKMIRAIPMKQARSDLKKIMKLNTAKEVRAYLLKRAREMFPELVEKGYLLD